MVAYVNNKYYPDKADLKIAKKIKRAAICRKYKFGWVTYGDIKP
jgi:hypothetical protein